MNFLKKIALILFLLSLAGKSYAADTLLFKKISPNIPSNTLSVEGFTIQTTQHYKGLYFITGRGHNGADDLSFKVLNKDKKTIYSSSVFTDAMYLELYFYEANGEIILLAENGFEYSTGGQTFLIENNTVNLLGTIAFAIPIEKGIARINNHLKVYKYNNYYWFNPINIDKVIANPGTEKEFEINADRVSVKFRFIK